MTRGALAIRRDPAGWGARLCERVALPVGRIAARASRAVLAWRLSNSMDVAFCVLALEEALAQFGAPEIFNTDQGSQFTNAASTSALAAAGVRISMDGRRRWLDNVFIERLWRSLKYEDIYLKGYADGREARAGIASWVAFYNHQRPHQALANRTPMAVWRTSVSGMFEGTAVDMTLCLGNADALPTSPAAATAAASSLISWWSERRRFYLNSRSGWST